MTAVADLTTVLTILKGSAPTNAQIGKVAALYTDTGTNEQKAAATIAGIRADLRAKLRSRAEGDVYATVLKQAHFPADQPALIASVAADATAAGDAAEADL